MGNLELEELASLIEEKMERTLEGIEKTLGQIMERGLTMEEVRRHMNGLEEAFSILSQRWVLQIMVLLLLSGPMRFSEIKKTLGISSRTLSEKLRRLRKVGMVEREVEPGPPVSTRYKLSRDGREIALLTLPLLYRLGRRSLLKGKE